MHQIRVVQYQSIKIWSFRSVPCRANETKTAMKRLENEADDVQKRFLLKHTFNNARDCDRWAWPNVHYCTCARRTYAYIIINAHARTKTETREQNDTAQVETARHENFYFLLIGTVHVLTWWFQHTHTHTHKHTLPHTYTYIQLHTHIHTVTYTHMHLHTRALTHTYTCTHTHTVR